MIRPQTNTDFPPLSLAFLHHQQDNHLSRENLGEKEVESKFGRFRPTVKIGFLHVLVMNNSPGQRYTRKRMCLQGQWTQIGRAEDKEEVVEYGGGGEETTNNLCSRKRSV